jgi:nudix-type nucleoside diphosphatase (YffH/AdpP family)
MFPAIRARAWSRVNAGHAIHGAATSKAEVEVSRVTRCYSNFYAVDELHLRHKKFNSAWSPMMERAVFHAADAALVLPYDPIRDRVMLIEQFRIGPFARGDNSCWQFEPIAGRLDPGEAPETTARREALEEAGLTLGALEKVAETYASPGNSSEFYYTFVGIADLPDEITGTHGLDAEDEDIRSHLLSFDELMTLCETGQAANTPLVMAAYWLARNRERLRSAKGKATP